jgi:hypothetical protein
MKGIVIYDTSSGNTKKIAETITETLKLSGIEVDLFRVKDVGKVSAEDYNFPDSRLSDQIWHNEPCSQVILGCGFALFSSPNTNAVMSSVERKFFGVASGSMGTMRAMIYYPLQNGRYIPEIIRFIEILIKRGLPMKQAQAFIMMFHNSHLTESCQARTLTRSLQEAGRRLMRQRTTRRISRSGKPGHLRMGMFIGRQSWEKGDQDGTIVILITLQQDASRFIVRA